MRILFTTFCLEKAGSHIVALTLASGMAACHEVFFFNQGEQLVDVPMVDAYLDTKVKLLDMTSFPMLNKLAWRVNGVLKRLTGYSGFHDACKTVLLLYVIVRYKIDIIHSHEILTNKSRLNAVLRYLSVPIVVTDHGGYTMLRNVRDASFVPFANKARAIVAVSNYTAEVLQSSGNKVISEAAQVLGRKIIAADYLTESKSLHIHSQKPPKEVQLTVPIVTIYNGMFRSLEALPMPEQIRQQLGINKNAFIFGMAGRGSEQKGWRFGLAAYQQLKKRYPSRDFAWLCMGEGPCLTAIQNELAGTAPDILFVGNVQNPHYYMSACHVGLVPSSFSEALPLTIAEFYEHEVPVIASNLGGIPEIIHPANEEPGGFLIEMEEDGTPRVDNLLQHMEAYANDPTMRAQHGRAALAIRRRFDIDQFVAAHEQLYFQVLQPVQK